MRAYERFLNYVKVYTRSDPESGTVPSTACQFDLAQLLAAEMREMGLASEVDEHSYAYGWLEATPGYEKIPSVMFCSHLDTADFEAREVKPQIIENYDGGIVTLGTSGRVLDPASFPDLQNAIGKMLITTDGTTLLGADDKAGIAEILTMAEILIKEEIPHGRICFAFTPDEEIGAGAKDLDLAKLGAEYGYTVDGGQANEIQYETFNAAEAKIAVRGFGVHPGYAKNTMINALLVAQEFNAMLPAGETPSHTEGYEGYYHLLQLSGTVDEAKMQYILRDHDKEILENRKRTMEHAAKILNEKYGDGTVTLAIRDEYSNMRVYIEKRMEIVDLAVRAVRALGMTEKIDPVRGGTDGSQLTLRGLPCPNLGAGGQAAHGPFEHICAEDMDRCTELLVELVKQTALC